MISTPHLPGYHIEELIYTGTNTLVYKGVREARRNQVNASAQAKEFAVIPVIIKVLRDTFSTLSQRVQFRNQYTIASQLRSVHVLRPLALERYDSGYALVTPDEGGVVLSKYWSEYWLQDGHAPLREFLGVAIQLAQALHDLGKQRVIHKDIKPSNILIHPETHHIQLIDFSLSSLLPKEQQQLANITVLEGTLPYLSPEQTGRMNRSLDYRTDFYSLGVSFYELLTQQLPFVESDPMALLHAHLAKMPTPPHEVRDDIPRVLSDIVLKLMAKNAEDRYQSALGLKHDLEQCLKAIEEQTETQRENRVERENQVDTDKIERFELGARDMCDRFLIPEKLYGRQSEVSELLNAFDRVSGGSTELVMVTGFSGIGKTAVVNEVHKPITRQQGYFIQGKFDQLNRNRPFSAFLQAFSNLIEQLLSEPDDQLDLWRTRILKAVGNNGQVLIDVIPNLGRIIGPQPPVIELAGSAAQNRFNLLLSQFVRTFATAAHPLVVFLDDLQWVDSASLRLLKLLIEGAGVQHLLILGAYRNNEVSPAHPLMLTLAELSPEHHTITTLTLEPLAPESITQLVADTLLCPVDIVTPLAQRIYQKTEGNPFFTTQFLQGLYREGLITFEADTGYWQCDLAAVQQLAATDGVVDFMVARLRKLPAATRTALMLAACIGNQFDLATLATVCQKTQSEIAADLWQGLQEGFVIPESDVYKFFQGEKREGTRIDEALVGYRFLHDRVQQAAYALIEASKRQETHWVIGQRLLAAIPIETTLETASSETLETSQKLSKQNALSHAVGPLFEIVNQLNAGSSLSTIPQGSDAPHEAFRGQLIQLNFLAGQQAKAATAYAAALAYFQEANHLLSAERWLSDYSQVLSLKCETIEAAYLSLNLAEVEPVVAEVLENAHGLLDKIKVYEIQIQAAIGNNQLLDAVNQGFDVLEQLGVTLLDPSEVTITLPAFDSLDNVPPMRDPAKVAALRILVSMFSAIYNGKPDLLQPTIWTMVNLCTTEGHTAVSGMAYSVYGMSRCGSGHVEEGYQSGQIALQLTEQPLGKAVRAKVLEQVGGFISHWKEHVKVSIEQFELGLQSGLDVGDIEYACHAAKNACAHLVLLGAPLQQVQQKQLNYIELGQQLNQQHILIFAKIWRQLSLNLIGSSDGQSDSQSIEPSEAPWMLVGESFDELAMLPTLKAKNNYFSLYVIYFSKQMLCYLFGEIDRAIEITRILESYSEASLGSLMSVVQNFYTSLILLAAHRSADSPAQHLPEQVSFNQAKMKQWAQHAPMNHLHKYLLVEAESQAILGRPAEAIELYDRAIALAKTNGYSQEEALANELAGKFYLVWGKRKVATSYLQEAYYGYAHWGAHAKTAALVRDYPVLLQPVLKPSEQPVSFIETLAEISPVETFPYSVDNDTDTEKRVSTSSQRSSHPMSGQQVSQPGGLNETLDLAAVLKASRAISQTMHLDELLHKLTTIILQSSGGDRCALILPDNQDQWQLQAIATLESTTLCTEPLDNNPHLPNKLIQYVKNSGQVVTINRLETELPIIDDYLQQHQPQSVLCLPLLTQGALVGILYLHNLCTSEVFTQNRLSILSFLCTEAATSLEKANLYQALADYSQQLESKVKARTRDLEQEVRDRKRAQAAAEVANRVKSEFLANMSHELRSPLNAIIGFAQIMSRDRALPGELRSDVKIIHNSGEHLLGLINNVLDMSKIEAGRTTLTTSDFDLYSLLDELQHLFQLKAAQKSLRYDISYSPDVPQWIHTDPGKLRQILTNLLSNALKFTDFGYVTLRISLEKDTMHEAVAQSLDSTLYPDNTQTQLITLTFDVEDSGPGIDITELDTIFEPFVQSKTGRDSLQGTGLGLSISRKFAQEMGGDISVTSPVSAEAGTLMSLRIQAAIAANMPSMVPSSRTVVGLAPGQPSYRIVIVDDQSVNRTLLVKLLQPLGFALKEAPDGPTAIALCRSWAPHLVLMDIRMPGMDGLEATERIKAPGASDSSNHLQATPPKVIALSASTLGQAQTAARDAGCDALVTKPFQETELLDAIGEHIGARYCYSEPPGNEQANGESFQTDSPGSTDLRTTVAVNAAVNAEASASLTSAAIAFDTSLSQLSSKLLNELETATIKLQWTEIVKLIKQIRPQNEAIAEALNQALQQFQYDQILKAVQAAKAVSHGEGTQQ
ncbi:MAG: AAA family ATPase [Cyanobacteria bacterium J06621_3]